MRPPRALRLLATGLLALAAVPTWSAANPCEAGAQRPTVVRTERVRQGLSVVARVRSGVQPKSVEITPDGAQAWVCNFGRPRGDNVTIHDSETLERIGAVEFQGNAVETTFDPNGRYAYVSNFAAHAIEVIDRETFEVVREVVVGGHPKVMAIAPGGRRMYVANWGTHQVTEIDLTTFEIRRRLRTGEHPRGMAIARGGQRIFVAAMYSHVIHVFDRGASRERTSFHPCDFPRHLLLSPDEQRLYASCSCCRQVRWFDTTDYRLRGIAQTGENPRTIALSRDGRWLAVADFDDSTVGWIDTQALTHHVVPVPDADQIVGVAIRNPRTDGELPRVYATSWNSGELIALEPPHPAPAEPADTP
ncbi:MAG: YncE family protein [Sandaracinaceae bacterium]